MSKASEAKAMAETLASWPLMKVTQVAAHLNCSRDHVVALIEDGELPGEDYGRGGYRQYRVDPWELAIYRARNVEGLTRERFLEVHGEVGTRDRVRRYLTAIRAAQAA